MKLASREPQSDDYLVHPAIDAAVRTVRWIGGAFFGIGGDALGLADTFFPNALGQANRERTRSVFDRYNVVSERDLHDVAAKLEEYIGKVESAREKDNPS